MPPPPRQSDVPHLAAERIDRRSCNQHLINIDFNRLILPVGVAVEVQPCIILIPAVLKVTIPPGNLRGLSLIDPISAEKLPRFAVIIGPNPNLAGLHPGPAKLHLMALSSIHSQ